MGRPRYSGIYRRMLQRLLGVEPTEKETTYKPACEHWFDDYGICKVCGNKKTKDDTH